MNAQQNLLLTEIPHPNHAKKITRNHWACPRCLFFGEHKEERRYVSGRVNYRWVLICPKCSLITERPAGVSSCGRGVPKPRKQLVVCPKCGAKGTVRMMRYKQSLRLRELYVSHGFGVRHYVSVDLCSQVLEQLKP